MDVQQVGAKFCIHFNIIFPFTPRSSNWSLSTRSPHQNPVCTSPVRHNCHSKTIFLRNYKHCLIRRYPRLCVFTFEYFVLLGRVTNLSTKPPFLENQFVSRSTTSKEWTQPDPRNTPSPTNPGEEGIADAQANDGNASMPEQVKGPNPWRMMMMMMMMMMMIFKQLFNKSQIYCFCNISGLCFYHFHQIFVTSSTNQVSLFRVKLPSLSRVLTENVSEFIQNMEF